MSKEIVSGASDAIADVSPYRLMRLIAAYVNHESGDTFPRSLHVDDFAAEMSGLDSLSELKPLYQRHLRRGALTYAARALRSLAEGVEAQLEQLDSDNG